MSAAAMDAGDSPANTTLASVITFRKTSQEALNPLTASVITFLALDTIVFLARAFSRHYIAKLAFWWDDLCITVGYVTLAAMGAIILVMVRIEIDYSQWDAEVAKLDEMRLLAKLIYAYLLLLTAAFAATRLAILALYLRIFQGRVLRRVLWAVVAFVVLQYAAFSLVSAFACWPVYKFWTPVENAGTCIDRAAFYRSMTPFNIAVDAVLVVLPLPTVWQLKATRFRKWALTFVFGLGILALVVSAIRLATLNSTKISVRTSPSNTNALFIWIFSKWNMPLLSPYTEVDTGVRRCPGERWP